MSFRKYNISCFDTYHTVQSPQIAHQLLLPPQSKIMTFKIEVCGHVQIMPQRAGGNPKADESTDKLREWVQKSEVLRTSRVCRPL